MEWRFPSAWVRASSSLPADRGRQGGDHRGLRAHRKRGQSRAQGLARRRDRGDCAAQPHAYRAAAAVLHAFLGKRRCRETGRKPEGGPEQGQASEKLSEIEARLRIVVLPWKTKGAAS